MIHNSVLPASLDQIDHVVVFYRVELTKVQQLAQGLAEKAKNLNDSNTKALEAVIGAERGDQRGERGEGGEGGRGRGERRGGGRGELGVFFETAEGEQANVSLTDAFCCCFCSRWPRTRRRTRSRSVLVAAGKSATCGDRCLRQTRVCCLGIHVSKSHLVLALSAQASRRERRVSTIPIVRLPPSRSRARPHNAHDTRAEQSKVSHLEKC